MPRQVHLHVPNAGLVRAKYRGFKQAYFLKEQCTIHLLGSVLFPSPHMVATCCHCSHTATHEQVPPGIKCQATLIIKCLVPFGFINQWLAIHAVKTPATCCASAVHTLLSRQRRTAGGVVQDHGRASPRFPFHQHRRLRACKPQLKTSQPLSHPKVPPFQLHCQSPSRLDGRAY